MFRTVYNRDGKMTGRVWVILNFQGRVGSGQLIAKEKTIELKQSYSPTSIPKSVVKLHCKPKFVNYRFYILNLCTYNTQVSCEPVHVQCTNVTGIKTFPANVTMYIYCVRVSKLFCRVNKTSKLTTFSLEESNDRARSYMFGSLFY